MKHMWKGPIAMDHLEYFQSIVNFYYNNPNQCMPSIDILINVVTTNTCTTTHILQHQKVQIGT